MIAALTRRLEISRTRHKLRPDPRRVLLRPFLLSEEILPDGSSRVQRVIDRILAMPEHEVCSTLREVLADFSSRHQDFEQTLGHHFQLSAHHFDHVPLSPERRLLVGAYFTTEYAIQAAALFSPSIVPAPGPAPHERREQRFVLSMRGVGEGHISSIQFRTGHINGEGRIVFDPPSRYARTGRHRTPIYNREQFAAKLTELGANNEIASPILYPLPGDFTFEELKNSILRFNRTCRDHTIAHATLRLIRLLAASNYVVAFSRRTPLSERVIFPAGPNESRGMEDARFVRFVGDDGSVMYYATYTAYDGYQILPQLIETADFTTFRVATLAGSCVQNKGMAIFPRPVNGRYAMLCRIDNENLFLTTSNDIRRWDSCKEIRAPSRPWELIQIGNCGSPLETEAGWLVLTHGVGPMRRYTIGAMLLDLDEPHRVLGELRDPLLEPRAGERDGYVPNVVYSCGGMIHAGRLVLPYGFSDRAIGIATIPLEDLLERILD